MKKLIAVILTVCALNGVSTSAFAHNNGSTRQTDVIEKTDAKRDGLRRMLEKLTDTVTELESFSTLDERKEFIMPIIVAGVRAQAKLYGKGDTSISAIEAVQNVLDAIEDAESFLNGFFEVDAAFSTVVKVLAYKEAIAEMID